MTSANNSNSRAEKQREPTPQEINHVIALFKQGRFAEAEALTLKMTARFSGHSFAWKAIGAAILKQGRYEEAIKPLQQAANLSKDDAQLYNNLGNAFAGVGRLPEAEASYWQALKLNPDFTEARRNMGTLLQLGRLPTVEKFNSYLFIVGAQKAGTTSLYSYLDQRFELVGGSIKEKCYFNLDSAYAKGPIHYRSLFPLSSKYACGIDATPGYLYYEACADRIHAFAPNAKIVVLLREPVSRALSAFNMYHQIYRDESFFNLLLQCNQPTQHFFGQIINNEVELSLEHFLTRELEVMQGNSVIEEPSLIRRGLYAPQIERYIHRFGRENVLILFSDDLKKDTHNVVNKVCAFIGLKPFGHREYPMQHVREYTVDQGGKKLIKQHASDFFAKDKLELSQKFGIDVPW